jgi:hypothetical protein
MRLNMSLLIVGSLVFFLSACKKSPPTPAVAAGADWTMYGGTNEVVEFARDNQVAQIFLSQSKTSVQEGLRSR